MPATPATARTVGCWMRGARRARPFWFLRPPSKDELMRHLQPPIGKAPSGSCW